MVSLSQTGRSANSLSKEYNVSVSTITKWIRQANPKDPIVLSIKERATVLRVVRINLEPKHRITRILTVLQIPRTTYYEYLKWTPS